MSRRSATPGMIGKAASEEEEPSSGGSQQGEEDALEKITSCNYRSSILGPTEPKHLTAAFDSALGPAPVRPNEALKVYLRLRPTDQGESAAIQPKEDGRTVRAVAPFPLSQRKEHQDPREYTFSKVMTEGTTQEDVYDLTVSPMVRAVMSETIKSGLVFAYGITNAGKTHTMLGSRDQPGLLPRAVMEICQSLCDEVGPTWPHGPGCPCLFQRAPGLPGCSVSSHILLAAMQRPHSFSRSAGPHRTLLLRSLQRDHLRPSRRETHGPGRPEKARSARPGRPRRGGKSDQARHLGRIGGHEAYPSGLAGTAEGCDELERGLVPVSLPLLS